MNKRKPIGQLLFWLFSFLLLSIACTNTPEPNFVGTDITGIDVSNNVTLINQHGKQKSLADFKSNIVILFFGFTSCPDICPTTLSKFKIVKDRLGVNGDRLKVIFVSLDPDRDTPDMLRAYLSNFGSGFEGLTGNRSEIDKLAKAFKIFYQKNSDPSGNYSIDHFAGSYMIDSVGRARVLLSHSQSVEDIIHDFYQVESTD